MGIQQIHLEQRKSTAALARTEKSPRYYLSKHVFVADYHGDWVFLDVKRDAFEAILRSNVDSVVSCLTSELGIEALEIDQQKQSDALACAQHLILSEMITPDAAIGKPLAPSEIPLPVRDIRSCHISKRRKTFSSEVFAFYYSATRAYCALKTLSLEDTIDRYRRKRSVNSDTGSSNVAENMYWLSTRFATLRNFFPSTGLCYFNAYALLEFLAVYGYFPTWTFGVRTRSFKAHCWVEHEGVVLNSTIEDVVRYTPIMAI